MREKNLLGAKFPPIDEREGLQKVRERCEFLRN
jgi:hypothetical protein